MTRCWQRHLAVMDSTATSLSMDNHIPVLVFALKDPENIIRAPARRKNRNDREGGLTHHVEGRIQGLRGKNEEEHRGRR